MGRKKKNNQITQCVPVGYFAVAVLVLDFGLVAYFGQLWLELVLPESPTVPVGVHLQMEKNHKKSSIFFK